MIGIVIIPDSLMSVNIQYNHPHAYFDKNSAYFNRSRSYSNNISDYFSFILIVSISLLVMITFRLTASIAVLTVNGIT